MTDTGRGSAAEVVKVDLLAAQVSRRLAFEQQVQRVTQGQALLPPQQLVELTLAFALPDGDVPLPQREHGDLLLDSVACDRQFAQAPVRL